MKRTLFRLQGFLWIFARVLIVVIALVLLGIRAAPDALVNAGREAHQAALVGDDARAAEAYHTLFELQGWEDAHLISAIEAEMRVGRHDQAEHDLNVLAERRPLTSAELGWLGTIYAARGQMDRAMQVWEQARAQGDLDVEALRMLADLYIERGLWDETMSVLTALTAAAPNDAEAFVQLGLLQAFDEADQAAISLGKAVALDPSLAVPLTEIRANVESRAEESPDYAYAQLGTIYLLDFNRLSLAEAALARSVDYNPAYAQALAWLAYVQAQLDQPALATVGQAVALDPQNPRVLFLAGMTWKELDQPAGARLFFERAYDLDPNNPATSIEIASTHRAEGGFEWAEIWMQEALRLAPNDPRFRVLMVQFYVDEDYKVEEVGFELAKQLVADYPDNAEAHEALALAYYLIDDLDSAQAEFDKAITLDPTLARAYLHMGQLMEQRGQLSYALWYYLQVVEIESNTVYAAQARRAIERLGGG